MSKSVAICSAWDYVASPLAWGCRSIFWKPQQEGLLVPESSGQRPESFLQSSLSHTVFKPTPVISTLVFSLSPASTGLFLLVR